MIRRSSVLRVKFQNDSKRQEMMRTPDRKSHQRIQAIIVQPGIKLLMNLEERTMNTNR